MGSRTHHTSARFRIVGWFGGVGVGRGGTSLFGGPTVATGAGETHGQSRSDLARALAQPGRPGPFTARWSSALWLLGLMAAAAGPLLVATGVIAALRLPPPHMSIWHGDLSSASLVVLPATLVGYHLTWERTLGRRRLLLWRASLSAWLNAWYCSRCHVVFLPEEYASVMRAAHLATAQPAAALRATLGRLAPLLVQSRDGELMRTLAGAMVATVLLGGCVMVAPRATSPDPVIIPTEAARIAMQVIRREFSAIQDLRPEELDAVESGVALRVDRARILDLRARHEHPPAARRIEVIRVAVPRQQRYPARFLALFRFTGDHGPTYNLANFTRPSARDPWTVDLAVDLPDGTTPPPFAITAGGWAGALPSRSTLEQAVDDIPLGYVEFRQGAWHRVEPTVRNDFRNPGPFTSDTNGRDQDQAASDRRNHILDDDTFAFDAADGTAAYAVAGGGALVLASLEEDFSQRVDPSAGGCIDVTNDGGILAPPSGHYGSIRLTAAIQAAFLDPSRAADRGVDVVALDRAFLPFEPTHATPCG